MAINIFQGSKGSSSGGNSKSQRTKAQTSPALFRAGYETSNDGTVAAPVKTSGSKILDIVQGVSGVASKLPGWMGKVGGIVNKLVTANDPEWWQSVPGNELPMSLPYNVLADGKDTTFPEGRPGLMANTGAEMSSTDLYALINGQGTYAELGRTFGKVDHTHEIMSRPFALEIDSAYVHGFIKGVGVDNSGFINCSSAVKDAWFEETDYLNLFLNVTDAQIVQYIYPEIRKVNNAVVLQDIQDYKAVFQAWCLIYAYLFQLRRMKYETTIANPLLPSLANNASEIQGPMKSTVLNSLIQSIEEYIASYVRLPHTIIEYLAWRFGRVYKTRNAGIAPIVVYNVIPEFDMNLRADFDEGSSAGNTSLSYAYLVKKAMQIPTATDTLARAAADLYNAYSGHNQAVSVADESQYIYDEKEFALRTNLRTVAVGSESRDSKASNAKADANVPVYVPFGQDNATVFMASTVSTNHSEIDYIITDPSAVSTDPVLGTSDLCLFPVTMVKGVRKEKTKASDLATSKLITVCPVYNQQKASTWAVGIQSVSGAIGGHIPAKWVNLSTADPESYSITSSTKLSDYRGGWLLCSSYHDGTKTPTTSFIDLSTMTMALTDNICEFGIALEVVSACMALDYYNANIRMPAADVAEHVSYLNVPQMKVTAYRYLPYLETAYDSGTLRRKVLPTIHRDSEWTGKAFYYTDLTSPSMPCGFVSREVLRQEQVYAFANLTFATRHEGLTKGNAMHEAAGVLANAVSDAGIIAK